MGVVEDIEDVCKFDTRRSQEESVAVVKSRKSRMPGSGTSAHSFQGDSFVPGTRSVYLKTWGCAHNSSDSEYMSGVLARAGYDLTDNKDAADLWLLNSCTVKTPSETQLQNLVKLAEKLGKPIVVGGCVSQAEPSTPWLKGVSIVGVQQLDSIVMVVEETLKGNSVRLLAPRRAAGRRLAGPPLQLPKIRRNPLIEIIPINTGCLNHCTYCKTKQARGDLSSYSPNELVDRARQAFEEGVKEIWLSSEDLGAWGRDIGLTLPDLLQQLVTVIPDKCMMRLGMTNPPYILDHLEEMADILRHPRVYAFLHVPVQSGSDAVLTDMRREYSSGDFCRVVDYMRKNVPGISIATDIICAFPSETEDDFEDTMDLVRRYKFPSLFINQFYPRPGTPAATRFRRINTAQAKNRSRKMSELFHSYHPYGPDRIGRIEEILVTEKASDGHNLVGHNKAYEQILVPPSENVMGSVIKVRITQVTKFSMKAERLHYWVPLADSFPFRTKNRYYLVLSMLFFSFALLLIVCKSAFIVNNR